MSNKRTVRVTKRLIDWALTQTSTQCAIALAIKDADEDFLRPRVTQETISFTDARNGVRYTFNTPEKVATWIDGFDKDPTTTKPLTLTIDLDEADKVEPVKRMQPSQAVERHQRYEREKGKVREPRRSYVDRPLRVL